MKEIKFATKKNISYSVLFVNNNTNKEYHIKINKYNKNSLSNPKSLKLNNFRNKYNYFVTQ